MMGNKISENKQRQIIMYKNIKNKIKKKHNLDVRRNIYISLLKEKELSNVNSEIFEAYKEQEESGCGRVDGNGGITKKNTREGNGTYVKINFKKGETHTHVGGEHMGRKCSDGGRREEGKPTTLKKKEDHRYGFHEGSDRESGPGQRSDDQSNRRNDHRSGTPSDSPNEKRHFELDYGFFFNVEERSSAYSQTRCSTYVKKKKKKKERSEISEDRNEIENSKLKGGNGRKGTTLRRKVSSLEMNSRIATRKSESVDMVDDTKDSTVADSFVGRTFESYTGTGSFAHSVSESAPTGRSENRDVSSFNSLPLQLLPDVPTTQGERLVLTREMNIDKCKKEDIEGHVDCSKKPSDTVGKSTRFLSLIKRKNILRNILSFMNCRDLLELQKTCSMVYVLVSDFLDYICLHIFLKFKRAYEGYFTPFDCFYKYEVLYTDNPSFRLDCILLAKIEKRAVGHNNRFGYKYKYQFDKKKQSSYHVYYNFNVLKKNVARKIEIHKDISYNNGDDINVSHIISNDVCANDYICIPINLFNIIGTVNFHSITFMENKLNRHITYSNGLDDQLWYDREEYKTLIKEDNLVSSECFLPYLKHVKTIYSGIDVTVMKSTYRAIQPGKLGRRSYNLWGNHFIIQGKPDPVFAFLKREGLQHDYIYHNFYLRVGDSIVFYLIRGGNHDV
ncbi:conserved Plasmodium protein, unknown function [Plasmodium knowlesi strain H]|uniref:F-box domain-containing protein n=3 Tax=Plasmodium knowlesi TaxID=5850 RepID=A0A1A7W0W4_PLAKH|nr:F-box protein FBXO1, putative [Plasmodium knowlesi strain H]OTN64746.1 Uncharacterized protein PKNOH_S130197100 [Plasmodium knowlesi]CAA9989131.1 F-box protein FBXO1, putative [Plasmodium knowlesi strain H]SBO27348.1 conserved Plasmodium protein, unknown function [Plasmodium knowlesi strain H]SBO27537.1 conserved Plasmodium protein, unknown function [Plasmodium knowlesi strain H]VVS78605.1 F-box protein FBXO1, putative [Plasmodium knowlesi strain H]